MLGEEEGTHLELLQGVDEVKNAKGVGVSTGFLVSDAKEMAGVLAKETNCEVMGPVSPGPGSVFYFVSDPDGYQVQLVQRG